MQIPFEMKTKMKTMSSRDGRQWKK